MTALQDPPPSEAPAGDPLLRVLVAVIDGARTSRHALCRALAADGRIEAVDCGEDAAAALGADVAFGAFLFHVSGPRPGLGEDLRAVADGHPSARVVVVATFVDEDVILRLRAHGATEVLTCDVDLDQVVSALVPVSPGRHLHTVPENDPLMLRAGELGITEREIGILQALSEGRSPQQIAHESAISVSTVRDHLKHLRHKLGCASAVELVVTAHRSGLLPNLNRPLP